MTQTLLQELNNIDIDWLMTTGTREKVDADHLLIKSGQQITDVYLLIDGRLTISVSQSNDNALNQAFSVLTIHRWQIVAGLWQSKLIFLELRR